MNNNNFLDESDNIKSSDISLEDTLSSEEESLLEKLQKGEPLSQFKDPNFIPKLISEYGSILNIPEDVLQANGLERKIDTERKSYSIHEKEKQRKLRGICFGLMKKYRGYIFSHDYMRMLQFIKSKAIIDELTLKRIASRAKRFIAQSIPPIFLPEFQLFAPIENPNFFDEIYSIDQDSPKKIPSFFPHADFIIQYATGSYAEQTKRKLKEQNSELGSLMLSITPTSPEEVRDFRSRAFRKDGEINPILIQDTMNYMEKNFDFQSNKTKNFCLSLSLEVFSFLEESLRDLKDIQPPVYKNWDGDLAVFSSKKWYMQYPPEDLESMAQTYFEQVQISKNQKDRNTFKYMVTLFPYLSLQAEIRLGIGKIHELAQIKAEAKGEMKKSILDKINRKDIPLFSNLADSTLGNREILIEIQDELHAYLKYVMYYFAEVSPENLFVINHDLAEFIGIPYDHLRYIPGFKKMLHEARLVAVQKLSDEAFKNLFINSTSLSSRFVRFGLYNNDQTNPYFVEFRNAVMERCNKIGRYPPKKRS